MDEVMDLYYSLRAPYRRNAVFIMKDSTITAIRKKQSSLSVGNIIGANIMDLTLIMPLCALILGKPLPVERQGMLLDIPACLVVCAGALIPALVQGKFKRWVGFFIGGLYIVYLVIMFTCFGA